MSAPKRLIVLGTLAANPYAGMAWMHMQLALGLKWLGHEVYYFEVSSLWPYDPIRQYKVNDSAYSLPYLQRIAESFGLKDCWAYRRSFADGQWFGIEQRRAEELLRSADAVFNVTGATSLFDEGLNAGRLIYYGTDPVVHEVAYAQGEARIRRLIDEHTDCATFGENIGTPYSPLPPLPRLCSRTRQPVLIDLWKTDARPSSTFRSIGNWKQTGIDIEFAGEQFHWSKHHEFLKFLDLPRRIKQPIELAMNLDTRITPVRKDQNEDVPSLGLAEDDRSLLVNNGWHITDAGFTTDPWLYRDYIQNSLGEFTVARDLNVRLKSGWFSERSACYLAAGRPVVTQNTGFGTVLPTGAGLFAFNTMDEILTAVEAINSDYERHSRAARDIAEEYFAAEKVLSKLLNDLGL